MGRCTGRSRTVASAMGDLRTHASRGASAWFIPLPGRATRRAEGDRPRSTRWAAGYPSGLQGVRPGGLPAHPVREALRNPGVARNHKPAVLRRGRTRLGVKPVGVPPSYEPETVAYVSVYASENPRAGPRLRGAVRALTLNQRTSPPTLDAVLATRVGSNPRPDRRAGVRARSGQTLRPDTRADTAGNGSRTFSRGFYNRLEITPTVRRGAAAGAALRFLAVLRRRSLPTRGSPGSKGTQGETGAGNISESGPGG